MVPVVHRHPALGGHPNLNLYIVDSESFAYYLLNIGQIKSSCNADFTGGLSLQWLNDDRK
jgi:hypothetical protein